GGQAVAEAGGGRLAGPPLDRPLDDVLFAQVGVGQDVAVGVHDGAVAGGRGLDDPAAGLHGPQPARGQLLGGDLPGAERGGVGGHEHHLGAVLGGDPGPVGEEDLVGDGDAQLPGRGVQHAGAVAGDGVTRHGAQVGEVLHQAPEGDVLAVGHPVDLVVAGDDPPVRAPGQGGVGEVVGAGVLDDAGDDGG